MVPNLPRMDQNGAMGKHGSEIQGKSRTGFSRRSSRNLNSNIFDYILAVASWHEKNENLSLNVQVPTSTSIKYKHSGKSQNML